jgi:shikimate kinase
MTNIVLIGLRGSGKTEIARRLARTMKRKFIDTDREIERQAHCSIAKLIDRKGWNFFRKIEKYVVRRVCKEPNTVISSHKHVYNNILAHFNVSSLFFTDNSYL